MCCLYPGASHTPPINSLSKARSQSLGAKGVIISLPSPLSFPISFPIQSKLSFPLKVKRHKP